MLGPLLRHACGMEWYDPGMRLDYRFDMKVFHRVRYILECSRTHAHAHVCVCRAAAQPLHSYLLMLFSFYGQAYSTLPVEVRLALDGWFLIWEITTVTLKVKCLFCMLLILFDILENYFQCSKIYILLHKIYNICDKQQFCHCYPENVYINCLWWQEITKHRWCTDFNLIIVQQDTTYSVCYISVGSSTCFGCWHTSLSCKKEFYSPEVEFITIYQFILRVFLRILNNLNTN